MNFYRQIILVLLILIGFIITILGIILHKNSIKNADDINSILRYKLRSNQNLLYDCVENYINNTEKIEQICNNILNVAELSEVQLSCCDAINRPINETEDAINQELEKKKMATKVQQIHDHTGGMSLVHRGLKRNVNETNPSNNTTIIGLPFSSESKALNSDSEDKN